MAEIDIEAARKVNVPTYFRTLKTLPPGHYYVPVSDLGRIDWLLYIYPNTLALRLLPVGRRARLGVDPAITIPMLQVIWWLQLTTGQADALLRGTSGLFLAYYEGTSRESKGLRRRWFVYNDRSKPCSCFPQHCRRAKTWKCQMHEMHLLNFSRRSHSLYTTTWLPGCWLVPQSSHTMRIESPTGRMAVCYCHGANQLLEKKLRDQLASAFDDCKDTNAVVD